MRILLTGCGGQLGTALAAGLSRLGLVTATDVDQLDVTDCQLLRSELDRLRPRLIVNAAAYTDVERAEVDQVAADAVNTASPAALADWAAANDAAVVHFSTDYVYDGAGTAPRAEDSGLAPLNTYGKGKLAGDRAILDSGAAALILRTSWLYAAQGQNFLSTMLRYGAERPALRVVDDQIGAPTSAPVLADITLTILAQAAGDPVALFRRHGGVVHASASGETSWHGFAMAIFQGARARGMSLTVERVEPIGSMDYPTRARRPLNSRLSLERLRQRFEVVPPDWRDGLAAVLDELAGRHRDATKMSHADRPSALGERPA